MYLAGAKHLKVAAVLTDIEGTTSSIDFVHEVLFPYASRKLPEFVRNNIDNPDIAAVLDDARQEAGLPDTDAEEIINALLGWIAEDRKATPLKALQGLIWRYGYENGEFTGHIYEDAARMLRKWQQSGIALYVYSSGSVAAQKLLFGHSDAGDLTGLFSGYFDTTSGHKRESQSYENIARQAGIAPADILFLSDVSEELDAAALAGMLTLQLVRDDKIERGSHTAVQDFDEISLEKN
jgi:enolase-phosphatase E1